MILKQLLRRSYEKPAVPLSDPDEGLVEVLGGGRSSTGLLINSSTALEYPAVYRAVDMISRDVAKLPLFVYRRLDPEGKERAPTHPAFRLLRYKPNEVQTADEFRQLVQAQTLLRGNGYAFVERSKTGAPTGLLPLDPSATYPVRNRGALWYVTEAGGEPTRILARDVLHLKGLPDPISNGLTGVSVVGKARESFGLGLAAREYAARFYGNDATPRAVLEHPGKLTDKAKTNLRASWEKMHQGLSKKHRTAILEEGMKLNAYSISPADAELLKQREFEIREVAVWFGIPPHKLGDPSRTSFASLEQENQSYLDQALDPWLVKWEFQAWDKLLTERQKQADSHVVEFLRAALIQADLATRFAAHSSALQAGWTNVDEVRAQENLNPLPDGQGQDFWRPANVVVVGEEPEPEPGPVPPVPPAEPAGGDDGDDTGNGDDDADRGRDLALEQLVRDAGLRIAKRIGTSLKRVGRNPAGLEDLVAGDGLVRRHRPAAVSILEPLLALCRPAAGDDPSVADGVIGAAGAILRGLGTDPGEAELAGVAGQLVAELPGLVVDLVLPAANES
jgi:HK97 family phage portal protein